MKTPQQIRNEVEKGRCRYSRRNHRYKPNSYEITMGLYDRNLNCEYCLECMKLKKKKVTSND